MQMLYIQKHIHADTHTFALVAEGEVEVSVSFKLKRVFRTGHQQSERETSPDSRTVESHPARTPSGTVTVGNGGKRETDSDCLPF